MYCSEEGYLLDLVNPKDPMTTGIVVAVIPHILLMSISRLYFDSFSVTLTEVFRSHGMAISMRMHCFVVLF